MPGSLDARKLDGLHTLHMAYGKLQSSLECIFAPHSSPQDRASAEAWCEEYSTAACQLAATALQQPEVASNQALFWYFVSCVQKHAASRYWHLDRAGKRDMQQVRRRCQLQQYDRICTVD